jgi:predicted Zn-dependent protease
MVAQQQTETARKGDNNSDGTAAVSMTDSKRPVADAAAPAQFAVLASLANFGLSPRFSSRDVASAELQQRQSEKISALREQLIQQPRSARTQLDLAAELVLAGDDIEALELIRDVLREQPDDSLALNALGIVQASRRNYGDALQSFRKASQDETLRVPASINAADMLIRLNRFSDAAALLQPLAADPSRSDSEKQSIQQVLDYLSRP